MSRRRRLLARVRKSDQRTARKWRCRSGRRLRAEPMGWLGSPAGVVCPRCHRLAAGGFPAGGRCSPGDWVFCKRDPLDIAAGGRPFEWVMLRAPRTPVPGYLLQEASR